MLLFVFLYRMEYIEISGENGHIEKIFAHTFDLHWIHSVEKEEWYETYTVKDGRLFLTKTYFKTYGAGVPTDSKYETKLNKNGFVEVTINEFREALFLNVSSNVKTEIHYDEKTIKLFEIYEDYTPVDIKVVKKPLIFYLLSI